MWIERAIGERIWLSKSREQLGEEEITLWKTTDEGEMSGNVGYEKCV